MGPQTDTVKPVLAGWDVCLGMYGKSSVYKFLLRIPQTHYFPSTPIEINHFPMRSVCTSLKPLQTAMIYIILCQTLLTVRSVHCSQPCPSVDHI